MRFSKLILPAFLLIATLRLQAQDSDLGNWFAYFGNFNVHKNWGIWLEGQHRNYNFVGDLEQAFVRTALLYNLPKANSQFSVGYGFFHSASFDALGEKRFTDEHRLHQQVITRQRLGRLYLMHRYRLEERFLKSGYRNRFRYMLWAQVCLNKPEMAKGTIYFSTYNELFINGKSNVFDRDRLYGGIGYSLGPALRVETWLMYQIFENRKRPQWQILCFHNVDLRRNDGD